MSCPKVRETHFILSPTHNGFGNQYMGIEKALMLALVLNRTMVLPPMLEHEDFNFFPRCGKKIHAISFGNGSFQAYKKVIQKRNGTRWTQMFDFSVLTSSGIKVVDFEDVATNTPFENIPRLSCDFTRNLDIYSIRSIIPDNIIAIVGSAFRMKLDILRKDLQVSSRCGWKLLSTVHTLPFQSIITQAAQTIIQNRLGPYGYDALHLRSGDKSGENSETVVAAVVHKIYPQLRLTQQRPIYVAYDLDSSFRQFSSFLQAICGQECGRAIGHANMILPRPINIHDKQKLSQRKDYLTLARIRSDLFALFGQELAEIALDLEIAANARALHLSDGARHTFRRMSSFGRVLRRRWTHYQLNRT